jgi:hypothetical protein
VWEVDAAFSRLYPVVNFDKRSVEPLNSSTREFCVLKFQQVCDVFAVLILHLK